MAGIATVFGVGYKLIQQRNERRTREPDPILVSTSNADKNPRVKAEVDSRGLAWTALSFINFDDRNRKLADGYELLTVPQQRRGLKPHEVHSFEGQILMIKPEGRRGPPRGVRQTIADM